MNTTLLTCGVTILVCLVAFSEAGCYRKRCTCTKPPNKAVCGKSKNGDCKSFMSESARLQYNKNHPNNPYFFLYSGGCRKGCGGFVPGEKYTECVCQESYKYPGGKSGSSESDSHGHGHGGHGHGGHGHGHGGHCGGHGGSSSSSSESGSHEHGHGHGGHGHGGQGVHCGCHGGGQGGGHDHGHGQGSCDIACTMEYVPVCGINKQGQYQTFGNACAMRAYNCLHPNDYYKFVKDGECS